MGSPPSIAVAAPNKKNIKNTSIQIFDDLLHKKSLKDAMCAGETDCGKERCDTLRPLSLLLDPHFGLFIEALREEVKGERKKGDSN